jgi:hypothetical protein
MRKFPFNRRVALPGADASETLGPHRPPQQAASGTAHSSWEGITTPPAGAWRTYGARSTACRCVPARPCSRGSEATIGSSWAPTQTGMAAPARCSPLTVAEAARALSPLRGRGTGSPAPAERSAQRLAASSRSSSPSSRLASRARRRGRSGAPSRSTARSGHAARRRKPIRRARSWQHVLREDIGPDVVMERFRDD